jgi:hypothetical protein
MNNIFKTDRIRINELYQDSINYLSTTYGNVGQYFTMASPMGQLLQIMLNYGKMILYYNEDSVTELNIRTATRPENIKGQASLTGHNPSRAMGARGTLRLSFNGKKLDAYTSVVTIPNYTVISNQQNGLSYTIILSSEEVRLNMTNINNYVDVNIIQGTLEYQQATGTGDALQSFNISTKKGVGIDNYFVNVYVNGVQWLIVDSILDMSFDQEACMVKTGQTGGLDIFFGNGYNGKVPTLGSTILVEYLITDGEAGNIDNIQTNTNDQWKFISPGYALNNDQIDLNKIINVSIKNSIIFGAAEEPLYLTRLLAPHFSRSFVLANKNNYIYFLKKLNIFTIIDAIPGFATFNDTYALDKYNQSKTIYEKNKETYNRTSSQYGVNSALAISQKTNLDYSYNQLLIDQEKLNDQKKDDNTVYLFLVPDINKRIAAGTNYYEAPISAFSLSNDEKVAILDLIEESGQRVITVDNAILELKYPRFVLNMSLILWEGYEYDTIRETILSKTSDYFLKNTRRDRIPVSDIVKVIESINGVDSVNVWFDADKNNINIYSTFYGIDDFGDIILERKIKDAWSNSVPIKDIYPLIRGGFESSNGVTYEDSTEKNKLSSINIQIRGYTKKDLNSENNKAVLNNL